MSYGRPSYVHSCPPAIKERSDWFDEVGRENQICKPARRLHSAVILCTINFVAKKISSMMQKHSFFTSEYGISSIKELERYEGFFPKFNESHCDQFSLVKQKTSPESTSSSSFSFADDRLSNASSSFSRFVS